MSDKVVPSSLGMKRKKLLLIGGLLLLMMLSSFPQIEVNQVVDEIPITFENNLKISHTLAEQMALGEDDELLSVIAVTTHDIDQTLINTLQTRVGYFEVKRIFTVLPSFEILVTSLQIEALATESMILGFEWGDREVQLCMAEAQSYSNIDDLRLSGGYNVDGTGITVAVVDSGLWTGHGDLNDGQVIGFKDIVTDGANDDFTLPVAGIDDVGHGTAMAGIIVGSGDGNSSLIGVAPGAKLVAVQIFNSTSHVYSNAVAGLDWVGNNASNYDIDIVSCSFGASKSPYYYGDSSYCDILARMADILVTDYDLIVVAAAGNYGPDYPAMEPSSGNYTICVGAVVDPSEGGWSLWNDSLGHASNGGPIYYMDANLPDNPDWYKPDVLAPGKNIMCLSIAGSTSYAEEIGTSLSTAFVSGLVALYLEYDGNLANDTDEDGNPDVKQLLWASAVDVPGDDTPGIDGHYGAGRVDGLAGLDFYTRDISSSKTNAVSFTATYTRNNEPMWRLDLTDCEDWYKYPATSDFDITISVSCDPDLMVEVILYRGTTLEEYDSSSERGEDCYIEHTGSTGADYYILVRLIGSYDTMGFPGDYYDIVIDITSF
ncbi:MAG: hypothetical protein E4H14_08945 [Candidatus Thorarchaeota archaeon]|nr:MAG: hypothetical protein E4H14_08945 [Candidatus Thorarchaeota archaeon]